MKIIVIETSIFDSEYDDLNPIEKETKVYKITNPTQG
jgi:hypothetical protein